MDHDVDDDFDRNLRTAFHRRPLPTAPDALAEQLHALPPQRVRPGLAGARLLLAAASLFAVIALAVVVENGHGPYLGSAPPAPTGQASIPVVSPSVAPSPSGQPSTEPSASPLPAPSAPPTPIVAATAPPAASVGPVGLIDPSHGWAIADQRLVLTSDGGASWYDMTPPALHDGTTPANLLNAEFLDPEHGWVAFAEPFRLSTDPGFGRVDVWRTSDGGRTWGRAELPEAVLHNQGDTLGDVGLDFLDTSHGYASITGGTANAAHDTDLYWTADGGRTWSADRPSGSGSDGVEGIVAFATQDNGVIAGGPIGSGIAYTRDAGKSWTSAQLSAPAGMSGALRTFGQPVFLDAQSGLVPVTFQADAGNVTRIYRTTDGGATWSFLSHVPGTGALHVSILDQQTWIATDGSDVVHTTNGGTGWIHITTRTPIAGLGTSLQDARFIDLDHGWAVWTDPQGDSHLVTTTHGGASWQSLTP